MGERTADVSSSNTTGRSARRAGNPRSLRGPRREARRHPITAHRAAATSSQLAGEPAQCPTGVLIAARRFPALFDHRSHPSRGDLRGAGNRARSAAVQAAVSTRPFRGSRAVAAGTVTGAELRGPRFRRLFTDVYVSARVEVDLALRSRAAQLRVDGVLGGWSAAEVLGASCGPQTAAAEVIVAGGRRRTRAGLVIRGDVLAADEITTVGGALVTTPVRTAWDLARCMPLVDAAWASTRAPGSGSASTVIAFGTGHCATWNGSCLRWWRWRTRGGVADGEPADPGAIDRDGLPIPVGGSPHEFGRRLRGDHRDGGDR